MNLKANKQKVCQLYSAKYTWDHIKTCSNDMEACIQKAKKAAKTDFNLLIVGKSGVGKELFAQAIHNESNRSIYPFIKINCAAIPDNLLESELFGYQEGAFTGASQNGKSGKFELADKGTLFFDEIADMPWNMQSKLLRVIQEGEITKLGGQTEQKVDVRIIAATNKNIDRLVDTNKFREDLFYRINVLNLFVPSLKDRKEDVSMLAKKFLQETQHLLGEDKQFSDEALESLKGYDWPGNVRQLKNTVQRLAVNTDHEIIQENDIPDKMLAKLQLEELENEDLSGGLQGIVNQVEQKVIRETLESLNYNKSLAADKLKVPRSTLYRKMKKYGLEEGLNEQKSYD